MTAVLAPPPGHIVGTPDLHFQNSGLVTYQDVARVSTTYAQARIRTEHLDAVYISRFVGRRRALH